MNPRLERNLDLKVDVEPERDRIAAALLLLRLRLLDLLRHLLLRLYGLLLLLPLLLLLLPSWPLGSTRDLLLSPARGAVDLVVDGFPLLRTWRLAGGRRRRFLAVRHRRWRSLR